MKAMVAVLATLVVLGTAGAALADHEGVGIIVAADRAGVTMVENSHSHVLVLAATTKVYDDEGKAIPAARLGRGDVVREECVPQPDGRSIAKWIAILRPAWRELESPEW